MTNPPTSKPKPKTRPKLPGHPRTITQGMSLLRNVKAFLTPSGGNSSVDLSNDIKTTNGRGTGFVTAKTESDLFTPTDPQVDGDECLHDCSTCTVEYPRKFAIDEDDHLFGHVKGWSSHLIVGTGKTDWVRDVMDEKGSVMEAVGRVGIERKNGKVMLSASDMPTGGDYGRDHDEADDGEEGSDCLLLPAWKIVERVRPTQVDRLMKEVVEISVTNEMPLTRRKADNEENGDTPTTTDTNGQQSNIPDIDALQIGGGKDSTIPTTNSTSGSNTALPPSSRADTEESPEQETSSQPQKPTDLKNTTLGTPTLKPSISSTFRTRPIPHKYLILMCSHKTRDARCGQSAPLLRKEFERILRPMGLYRDLHDDRPNGVGVYFINHVGGHKYSANVMIYRRGAAENGDGQEDPGEATQLIWLARVRPEDCENIVRFTVLQGKVVKPRRQLRGGFDRERGVASW